MPAKTSNTGLRIVGAIVGVAVGAVLGYLAVGQILNRSDDGPGESAVTAEISSTSVPGDIGAAPGPPPVDAPPASGSGLVAACRNADVRRVADATDDLEAAVDDLVVSGVPTEAGVRRVLDRAVIAADANEAVLVPIMDGIAAESDSPTVRTAAANVAESLRSQAAQTRALQADSSLSLLDLTQRFIDLGRESPMLEGDAQTALTWLATVPECQVVLLDFAQLGP